MNFIYFPWNKRASLELAIAFSNGPRKCIVVRILKWAWRIELRFLDKNGAEE